MSRRPPLLGRALLRMLPEEHRDYVAGDLLEEYDTHVVARMGPLRARAWLVGQSLRSLLAFWIRPPHTTPPGGPGRPLFELRFAARGVLRQPGFSLLAVLTLATGIGAATSVFSVANWLLIRPLPGVVDQERLVVVQYQLPDGNETGISPANLRDLAAGAPALSHLAGHTWVTIQASLGGQPATTLRGEAVTGSYFELLGARPALGRLIAAEEADADDGQQVVVLSYRLWTSAFDASPAVIGRTIRLNGLPFTVIGVTEPGFNGTDRLEAIDLWVPAAREPELEHTPASADYTSENRAAKYLMRSVGRLASGASPQTAQAQLRATMASLVAAYPDENGIYADYVPTVFEGIGLRIWSRTALSDTLKALSLAVLLVLMLASANVTGLMVVREIRRQGETAIRRALGAGRIQLMVHRALEAGLIAAPAVALGLVIAHGLNRLLWSTGLRATGPLEGIGLDWRVGAVGAALGLVSVLGIAVATTASDDATGLAERLKASARTGTRKLSRLQGALTIGQLGLSLSLLAAASLLARSVYNLASVDLGLSPDGVAVHLLDASPQGYDTEEAFDFLVRVLEEVRRANPELVASLAQYEPFSSSTFSARVSPAGSEAVVEASFVWVADDYFEVLGIPILEGRELEPDEVQRAATSADPVPIVLNRRLARSLFGEASAVGRHITIRLFGTHDARVVGVAGDVFHASAREAPPPQIHLPVNPRRPMATLLTRSRRDPRQVSELVTEAVRAVDPDVPVYRSSSMSAQIERTMAEERTLLRLLGVLAIVAIGLAGVGLHSVIRYAVEQRVREFGIRLALGAESRRLVATVMCQALGFGAAGLVAGLAVTVLLVRVIRSHLFGVVGLDPLSLALAAAILLAIVVLSSTLPALTATRVDPARTLVTE